MITDAEPDLPQCHRDTGEGHFSMFDCDEFNVQTTIASVHIVIMDNPILYLFIRNDIHLLVHKLKL
jgi:hypothetical protein